MEKVLSPLVLPTNIEYTLPISRIELDLEVQVHQHQDETNQMEGQPHLMSNYSNNTAEDSMPATPIRQNSRDQFMPSPTQHYQRGGNFRSQRSVEIVQRQDNAEMEQSNNNYCIGTSTSSVAYSPTLPSTPTQMTLNSRPGRNNGSSSKTVSGGWLSLQPKLNAKSKSGYILFSAEVRKRVMNENPGAGFGEISKIVGIEWKRLSDEQKSQYETRAQYIAEERAKADLLTPSNKMPQPGQIRVHCCRWQQCDYQFDSQEGLYEHIRSSHTSQIMDGDNQFVCLWNSCLKYRKEGKPFPSLPRLHRHIKEKHLYASIRVMFPNQRSKHFFVYVPSSDPPISTNGSTSKMHTGVEEGGRFIHSPYGEMPANPVPCTIAIPMFATNTTSTSVTTSILAGSHHQAPTSLTAALAQPSSSMGMSGTRFVTPKSTYGDQGTLLNGSLRGSAAGIKHHYLVQGSSQMQPPQQQLPTPPEVAHQPQKAIVVNGVTVMIPANAQTVILPPGYLGPQQTQQIILHTAPNQPPPLAANGPSNAHFQVQPPSQIIVQQQANVASSHSMQQQQIATNGIPQQTPTTQFISAASSSTPGPSSSSILAPNLGYSSGSAAHPAQLHAQTSTTAAAMAQQQQAGSSNSQVSQQVQIDAGRTVVQAPRVEPIFVEPSGSLKVQRALHSEAYVRYIESLYNTGKGRQQRTVSKWDTNLQASQRNTVSIHRTKPYEWIKQGSNGLKPKEDEIVRALWKLRDHLVEGTTGVQRIKAIDPHLDVAVQQNSTKR